MKRGREKESEGGGRREGWRKGQRGECIQYTYIKYNTIYKLICIFRGLYIMCVYWWVDQWSHISIYLCEVHRKTLKFIFLQYCCKVESDGRV